MVGVVYHKLIHFLYFHYNLRLKEIIISSTKVLSIQDQLRKSLTYFIMQNNSSNESIGRKPRRTHPGFPQTSNIENDTTKNTTATASDNRKQSNTPILEIPDPNVNKRDFSFGQQKSGITVQFTNDKFLNPLETSGPKTPRRIRSEVFKPKSSTNLIIDTIDLTGDDDEVNLAPNLSSKPERKIITHNNSKSVGLKNSIPSGHSKYLLEFPNADTLQQSRMSSSSNIRQVKTTTNISRTLSYQNQPQPSSSSRRFVSQSGVRDQFSYGPDAVPESKSGKRRVTYSDDFPRLSGSRSEHPNSEHRFKSRSVMFRDETATFFGNLKNMYSSHWYAGVHSQTQQIPDPLHQYMFSQHIRAEQEMLRQPSNLPTWAVPSRSVNNVNASSFALDYDYDNVLGPKWATEAAYVSEMNRVPLRKWESSGLGKALQNSSDEKVLIGDGTRFTLMCYNILSPKLQETHSYLYKDCDPEALDFENRKRAFFAEIELYKPDIICLQEVETDLFPMYEQLFAQEGYRGVFKKRTRDKDDGCAIFFRESKFSLVDTLDVEFYQPHVPILDRDNVGILVKLETKRGRKQKLVVGTTHLLFNPKRLDVKMAQVQLLLAELDRFSFLGFSRQGQPIYHPTIITGDFNTQPVSPISKLLTVGALPLIDENGLPVRSLRTKGRAETIPSYLGISDQCQHYKILHQRIKHHKNKTFENDFSVARSNHLVNINKMNAASESYSKMTISKVDSSHSRYSSGVDNVYDTASDTSSLGAATISDTSVAARVTSDVSVSTPKQSQYHFNNSSSDLLNFNIDAYVDEEIIEEIMEHGTLCTFGSGEFSHQFHFRDVHEAKLDRDGRNEALATTKQNGWVCVDYIYYSTMWNDKFGREIEGKLKLVKRLGLLDRKQCQSLGSIPRIDIPSDHFPLVAEFLLKP